jgi:hypothetical protein
VPKRDRLWEAEQVRRAHACVQRATRRTLVQRATCMCGIRTERVRTCVCTYER